jgi:hypothetical protein
MTDFSGYAALSILFLRSRHKTKSFYGRTPTSETDLEYLLKDRYLMAAAALILEARLPALFQADICSKVHHSYPRTAMDISRRRHHHHDNHLQDHKQDLVSNRLGTRPQRRNIAMLIKQRAMKKETHEAGLFLNLL